jgi:hypothetical protein
MDSTLKCTELQTTTERDGPVEPVLEEVEQELEELALVATNL